ncbi:hypothetical protein CLAVI_001004 [Candidatus Clavichlamydia salmonicola]|uniref:hypothetical protein n=1 Tax=Candidatus Clavichlamydia salmonicola TaxID=469812 RepID=UPI001890FE1B|nr:hypothetical protein [Candidatus Clavichlamydia salmonicola]MBF5051361.1 hypothetical protein [Candidatus Clavichlamydia salmonicola]
MGAVGNGFASGIEYLNKNFFSCAGRRCPSSLREFRANVSQNVKTCAKICTVFMDSSFGLSCAIGVVGITTASLCAGEDVVDLITTTILPATTALRTTADAVLAANASLVNATPVAEQVYLCFKQAPTLTISDFPLRDWKPKATDICPDRHIEVDCGALLNNVSSKSSIFLPELMDLGPPFLLSYEEIDSASYDLTKHYLARMLYRMAYSNMTGLVKTVDCLREDIFYVANHTFGKILKFSDLHRGVCQSDNGGNFSHKAIDHLCLSAIGSIDYYFLRPHNVMDHHLFPLPPELSTDPAPKTISNVVQSALTDSCGMCHVATLVFGVGSAVVFVLTSIKALYQQHKARRCGYVKVVDSRLRKATAFMFNDGLLWVASGLGSTILMTLFLHPCSPVEEGAQKAVVVSTVLHGVHAFSKLAAALICKSEDLQVNPEEAVMLEMGILKKSKNMVELQELAFLRFSKILQKMEALEESVDFAEVEEWTSFRFDKIMKRMEILEESVNAAKRQEWLFVLFNEVMQNLEALEESVNAAELQEWASLRFDKIMQKMDVLEESVDGAKWESIRFKKIMMKMKMLEKSVDEAEIQGWDCMRFNEVMQKMKVLEESIESVEKQARDCMCFDEVEKLDPDLLAMDSMFNNYYANVLKTA